MSVEFHDSAPAASSSSYGGWMARALRKQVAGLTYHVTSRGNRREAIFRDEIDRYRFLGLLAGTVRRCEWLCHAYCLMTTHYHLLVTTPHPNLARGMQRLNGSHGSGFNSRHKLTGHVFQGRYHSVIVEREPQLLELVRYIALNPVRAGLCATPEDWPWSSYRYTLGLDEKPAFLARDFLLECFAENPERAPAQLRNFVLAGLRRPHTCFS
jgi:REP-associated tyrosine transposase